MSMAKDVEDQIQILRQEFSDISRKMESIMKKYEKLDKQYNKLYEKSRKYYFKCKKCDNQFETLKDLQEHKTEGCDRQFCCEHCDEVLNDKNELRNHIEDVHKGFECEECGSVFKFESYL